MGMTESDLETARVVEAFNEAVNRHDVDAMVALTHPRLVFEGTAPPDGERLVGHEQVRSFWERLFAESPHARVETESLFTAGQSCTVLLNFVFDSTDPASGHVRGVDVLRVEDGLITEKLSYVKG
jgi:ketosteroid isomerase-like protein